MNLEDQIRKALSESRYGDAAALDVQLAQGDAYTHGVRREPRTARDMRVAQIADMRREMESLRPMQNREIGTDSNSARSRAKQIQYRIELAHRELERVDREEAQAKDLASARAAEEARDKARGPAPDFRGAGIPDEQRLALAQQYAAMKAADPCAAVLFAQRFESVLFDPQTTAVYAAWKDGPPAPPQGAGT